MNIEKLQCMIGLCQHSSHQIIAYTFIATIIFFGLANLLSNLGTSKKERE